MILFLGSITGGKEIMNKRELENIIGKKLGAEIDELKTATDVFIQSVSEYISVGDTIRIPDIGMFQLKKIEKGFSEDSVRSSFRLFYVPLTFKKGISDIIAFNVVPDLKKRDNSIDGVFSISIGKPLIPLTETGRNGIIDQSSKIMAKGSYREKSIEILENAIHLKDFKLDISPSLLQEDIIQSVLQEEEDKQSKEIDLELSSIPWDFGIPIEPENLDEKVKEQKAELNDNRSQSGLKNKVNDNEEENKLPEDQLKTISNEIQEDNVRILTNREEELSNSINQNELRNIENEIPDEIEQETEEKTIEPPEPEGTNKISESDITDSEKDIENIEGEKKKSFRLLWLIIFIVILIAAALLYYFFIYQNSKRNNLSNFNTQIKYRASVLVENNNLKKDSLI